MDQPESRLPGDVLDRASVRGKEYAWPVEAIPDVIDAARASELISIGGQLQLRFPDGPTCEAYWIEVDTLRDAPLFNSWSEKVAWSAGEALAQFQSLQSQYDFEVEVRKACSNFAFNASSDDFNLNEALCFVWCLEAEPA